MSEILDITEAVQTDRVGERIIPVLVWPDGTRIHLMPHDIESGQNPRSELRRWLAAWREQFATESQRALQTQLAEVCDRAQAQLLTEMARGGVNCGRHYGCALAAQYLETRNESGSL